MTGKLPYKPLSDPRNMVIPKPGDFSHREKRKRLERQRMHEAWLEEAKEQEKKEDEQADEK